MAQREAGNYSGTLMRGSGITTHNGKPAIKVVFMIDHKLVDNTYLKESAPNERDITIYMTDAAMHNGPSLRYLKALGWDGDPENPKFKESDSGYPLVCTINDRGYEQYNFPDDFGGGKGNGQEDQPMAVDAAQIAKNAWLEYTATNAVPAGKPHVPVGADGPPEVDEDDIPF